MKPGDIFRSGGQTYQMGPRPKISVPKLTTSYTGGRKYAGQTSRARRFIFDMSVVFGLAAFGQWQWAYLILASTGLWAVTRAIRGEE